MGVETWLTVIGGFLTLAAAAASGFAVIRSKYSKTQLEIQDQTIKAYEKRVQQQAEDIAACVAREAAMQLQLDASQREVQVLHDIVTSKQEIQDLRAMIELNHRQSQEISTRTYESLTRAFRRLGALEEGT